MIPKYTSSFPGGSVVKNPPAKQEMQDQSLGREDTLEKELATQSSVLAWEIPWTEEQGGLQSMGLQGVGYNLAIKQQIYIYTLFCHIWRANMYVGQEATVRTESGTKDWFQIGKGVCQGCILSPCLFNLYEKYIMRNAGLEEAQAGIKIAGRNINNLICRWHHPYGRKLRRTKEPLDESEREEWKSWLTAQHSEN